MAMSAARWMRRNGGRGARTGSGPVKTWLNMQVPSFPPVHCTMISARSIGAANFATHFGADTAGRSSKVCWESGGDAGAARQAAGGGPRGRALVDRDLFNDEFEADWRAHLEALANEDLLSLDPRIFCAGFLDRVARMKRAYADEMAARKLKARGE